MNSSALCELTQSSPAIILFFSLEPQTCCVHVSCRHKLRSFSFWKVGFHFIFMSFVHLIALESRFRLASQNGAPTRRENTERSLNPCSNSTPQSISVRKKKSWVLGDKTKSKKDKNLEDARSEAGVLILLIGIKKICVKLNLMTWHPDNSI